MFEGFLEMQSVVTRVQGQLELGGEQEYRKIEFGTERHLHTPEPGNRGRFEKTPLPLISFIKFRIH
ncbi:MAG: hypothetical protein E7E23_15440 [Paenibacillus sp.]|uniref:hypothetical protein n=1 Tax=Paenibacillus sp. TaxID=58172 RepID=UPI002900E9CD|nr:hypothetical protein [Paenibacillus sp.]MDU2241961.1 hypothetical protein [Paenibacillus sp.]